MKTRKLFWRLCRSRLKTARAKRAGNPALFLWPNGDTENGRDCSLVDNDVLVNELALPLYSFSSAGKIKIEGKDETKKRYGGKSPDLADAFILTFASSAAMAAGSGRWVSWNKPIEYRSAGIV